MKPSFLSSTLSLAFMVSVVSIIVMIFAHVTPDPLLLAPLTGIIGAYLGSRIPHSSTDTSTDVATETPTELPPSQ
jgi:uncharacterized membrane protein YfcA